MESATPSQKPSVLLALWLLQTNGLINEEGKAMAQAFLLWAIDSGAICGV